MWGAYCDVLWPQPSSTSQGSQAHRTPRQKRIVGTPGSCFDKCRALRHLVERFSSHRMEARNYLTNLLDAIAADRGHASFELGLDLASVPIVDKCRKCLDISQHYPRLSFLFFLEVMDLRDVRAAHALASRLP
jgi:hypothetical protein